MANFNIVRDAPRLECARCKTAKVDVFMKGKDQVVLSCESCSVLEYISREEFSKLFE